MAVATYLCWKCMQPKPPPTSLNLWTQFEVAWWSLVGSLALWWERGQANDQKKTKIHYNSWWCTFNFLHENPNKLNGDCTNIGSHGLPNDRNWRPMSLHLLSCFQRSVWQHRKGIPIAYGLCWPCLPRQGYCLKVHYRV